MIFFVVPLRAELPAAIAPSPEPPDSRLYGDQYRVVPWWTVYPRREDFFDQLLATIVSDDICQVVYRTYKASYGKLRPEVVEPRFAMWCHPLVGNLMSSPRPRPTDFESQSQAWTGLVAAADRGEVSAQRLAEIARSLPDLTEAPIDECRVVRNLTELARALVGDLTSRHGLAVERILALRLARSEMFHRLQAGLLLRSVGKWSTIDRQIRASGFQPFEYTGYYLPALSRIVNADERANMLRALIGVACFDSWPTSRDPGSSEIRLTGICRETLFTWMQVPRVVACAALINDLNKLNQRSSGLAIEATYPDGRARPNPVGSRLPERGVTWGVEDPQKSQGLPRTSPDGARWRTPLVWSWNRNEYSTSVITYRSHLCPQWGGSSGHTTGGVAYWLALLNGELVDTDAATVATSLYVLWNLCYDVRLSPVHRMVETLEVTMHPAWAALEARALDVEVIPAQESVPLVVSDGQRAIGVERGGYFRALLESDDAWTVVASAFERQERKITRVNPIALMDAARRVYGRDTALLPALVQAASRDLGSFSWLPDWSALGNRASQSLGVLPSEAPQALWRPRDPTRWLEALRRGEL